MNLLIAAPLAIEARALTRGPAGPVRVLRTGAGLRRATLAARRLPDFDVLVVAGFGGALVPGLRPGDLFVATEVRDPTTTHPCPGAGRLAAQLAAESDARVRVGVLLTSDHIVRGAERGMLAASGGHAVDMEAAPLVAEAAARGRPFAVVRAVVDTPDQPLLRPGTLRGGLLAYRRLRALRPALLRWAADITTTSPPSPRR
jgi:4-hydroxy-3-methylbut-2-enyl diphosphate reductase